jgi:DNA-binding protein H-NS
MSEFLKVLLNIRSLRAALRELSLDQLKEAHEKIELIYLERLEVAEKEQATQAEHQQKLAEFQVYRSSYHLTPASNRCLVYATLSRTSFGINFSPFLNML